MWFLFFPLALCLGYVIYNRFLHPLAKVPGPFLASISPLWIAYQSWHQRRPGLDLKLHQRYGSVVRISPSEVIFSNPEHFKAVYGAGTRFTKGRFYEAPTDSNPKKDWNKLDMLAELDIEKLRVQRRFAGRVYSMENAKRHEGLLDNNIQRFVGRMKTLTERPLDVYHEFELLNIDTMTEFTFGSRYGAIEAGSDGDHMAEMDKMWEWWGWIGNLPWLNRLDKMFAPWSVIFKAPSLKFPVFQFCGAEIGAYHKAASEGQERKSCLMHDLQQVSKARPEFPPSWGNHMALTDLGAGVDTMSWTLATVIVGVGRDPRVWAKVKAELDSAVAQGKIYKDEPVPYDEAVKLEYLQACMQEAMRLWPNVAISLPRVAPTGGIELDGHYVPAGYTVGMNSSQLGRNQHIFGDDAESFRPERWLEANKTKRSEMETKNLAFGGPSRRCPGLHVAWLSMSKVLTSLYLNFEIEVLNRIDGEPGPGGHVWREKGSFPTKWHGLEVRVLSR